MSTGVASKAVMQSALDQWTALDKLSDLSREFLTPEQLEVIEAPMRERAEASLRKLNGECVTLDGPPEITEVVSLRQKLKKIARRK